MVLRLSGLNLPFYHMPFVIFPLLSLIFPFCSTAGACIWVLLQALLHLLSFSFVMYQYA
jgi:hypothetical protein